MICLAPHGFKLQYWFYPIGNTPAVNLLQKKLVVLVFIMMVADILDKTGKPHDDSCTSL